MATKTDGQDGQLGRQLNLGEEQGSVLPEREPFQVPDNSLTRSDGGLVSVRKPVEVAALIPRTNRLNMWSRKAWLFLIAYALKTRPASGEEVLCWRVPVNTLVNDARFPGRNWAHLRQTVIELQDTQVQWAPSVQQDSTGERIKWERSALLAGVSLIETSAGDVIEFSLSHNLLRELRANKHFYVSSLEVIAELRLHSSIALYELACRYKTSPNGFTMRLPWRDWIPILSGEPEEEDLGRSQKRSLTEPKKLKYPEFRYFSRDVVDKAIAEVNSVQDEFRVEKVKHTKGTTVVDLQFRVTLLKKTKPAVELTDPIKELRNQAAIDKAINAGTTRAFAEKLHDEHGPERLAAAADKALSTPGLRNPAGFLVSSLNTQPAEAPKALPSASASPVAVGQPSLDVALAKYRARLQAQAKLDWPNFPSEVQADYLQRFDNEVGAKIRHIGKELKVSGLKKPYVAASFYTWLAEKIAEESGAGWSPTHEVLIAYLVAEIQG